MLCYELERSTKIFILVVRFTSVKYVRTNFNSVTCNSLILGWGNVEKKSVITAHWVTNEWSTTHYQLLQPVSCFRGKTFVNLNTRPVEIKIDLFQNGW